MSNNNGIPEGDWVDVSIDSKYNIRRKVIEDRDPPWEYEYQTNSVLGDSETWHPGLPQEYYATSDGDVVYIPAQEPPKHSALEHERESEAYTFIDSNPKTAFGAVKPGTFQTPPIPLYEYSLAHYQGALKYGHYNWREDPVSISTYINAARRHIDLYLEGQRDASDTGIHNLAHAMTCLSIVIDAEFFGTLIDDRAPENVRAADKMEAYFEEKKPLQQKIMKDWTGHAQKLRDKLLNRGKK
jgi:hypothetical protein